MRNGYGSNKNHKKGSMMEEKTIKTVILAAMTIISEAIDGITIPDVCDGANKDAVSAARTLLYGNDAPVSGRNNLYSIFNQLNGNNSNKVYVRTPLLDSGVINYPTDQSGSDIQYKDIASHINELTKGSIPSQSWLNTFIERLENELTYVPGTLPDPEISLFDQAKLCAALAFCISDVGKGPDDMQFMLYSMDFSGIQDFIYTITSKGALKTLRARSFYLELLMENIIDLLLDKLGLSRFNVIYSGGGHCYLIIPNTKEAKDIAESFNTDINNWLTDTFDISLYVGHGYAECSGNTLRNIPEGSYVEIFRNASRMISEHKAKRYTAEQIKALNNRSFEDYTRECKICRKIAKLTSEDICPICSSIKDFSSGILKDSYFIVRTGSKGLPIPFGCTIESVNSVEEITGDYIRLYRKRAASDPGTGAISLWVGDYASKANTLEEMANAAKDAGRIERIGVLRADVDNLGTAFSSGFKSSSNISIMKTAALSRQLSLFFKHHLNQLMKDKDYNATICYSGGDDLFIIGEWNNIIDLAIDISGSFSRFSEQTLSISGGIGIYDSKYPISRIAYDTAEMEDRSKKHPGKNAITIFEDNTYGWQEFEKEVIGEKHKVISDFFNNQDTRGMNFLYNLLELIRNQTERINFARFIYTLSRLEPNKSAEQGEKDQYKHFAEKMIEWIKNEKDRKQMITAVMLYVYQTRNKNKEEQ